MKRDLDLIRKILFYIESKETLKAERIQIEGYKEDMITYHIMLLSDAGLIEVIDTSSQSGYNFMTKYLTWSGHEFLDSIRKDSIWEKAKKIISEKTNSIPIQLLQSLLTKYLESELGLDQ